MTTNEMQSQHEQQPHQFELDVLKIELGHLRQQLNAADRLSTCLIESASEGILITDAHNVIRSVNPAFERSTGYSASEVVGRTPAILKSSRHDQDFYREMWDALDKKGQWQGEIWNRHKNGETYPEWLNITTIRDNQQQVSNYVGVFSNGNTHESIIEHLHYLAYYDGLTGLPNRQLFMDRLNVAISHARRNKHMLAVMFIDLDQFKLINDTLGHKAGDDLLKAVTERMKRCIRDGDTLARLAGDEFTVLIPFLPHPDAARNVAEKFMECYSRPLQIDGHELNVTASIGIVIYPKDGKDAESLLHHADLAMYNIKGAGRNGYLHYGIGMSMHPSPGTAS